MSLYIIPDSLREAINARLDSALAECPDAAPDREIFYGHLLAYFNEHGVIPEFRLQRNEGGQS